MQELSYLRCAPFPIAATHHLSRNERTAYLATNAPLPCNEFVMMNVAAELRLLSCYLL
jgi:hypothetical protein